MIPRETEAERAVCPLFPIYIVLKSKCMRPQKLALNQHQKLNNPVTWSTKALFYFWQQYESRNNAIIEVKIVVFDEELCNKYSMYMMQDASVILILDKSRYASNTTALYVVHALVLKLQVQSSNVVDIFEVGIISR